MTITATIPQPSEPSGDLKVSSAFILKVGENCDFTNFIDKTFNDMTIKITESTSQDIFFQDDKALGQNNDDFCGPRIITFTGGLPNYL